MHPSKMFHSFTFTTFLLLPLAFAAPTAEKRQLGPSAQLSYANVVGSSLLGIDSFKGIPYAQPPVGNLRLRPPQRITSNLGTIQAIGTPRSCPQFSQSTNTTSLASNTIAKLQNAQLLQDISNDGEDCLTVNVQRPSTATANSKLPVVFWIFGGGFETGSTQIYDASQLILNSVTQGKDIIYVSVNYRLGGFGFLPGAEILKDGSSNLGLLDQRLGLEWVADNIAAFGGDPDKVTIWGESAGSISVFDQFALYGGDNTYNGKPLFRAGIMDSGSVIPADPVDCPKGQEVYNAVVSAAGCSGASDTLSCLRSLDYTTYLNAANSVPGISGYTSVALSYLPRPDGKVLPDSPEVLVANKQYAPVPFIIGDQEDEGTLFALPQTNLTTTADLEEYFQTIFFRDATPAQISQIVESYPDDPSAGSPFNTGLLNNIYPQFKRLAAILGDLTFTLTRRAFLSTASEVNPNVNSWSYLASYDYGTPVLGTFHASDIPNVYGITPGFPQATIQGYYINFINSLDPNGAGLLQWPTWSKGKQLVNFQALQNVLITDNFRSKNYDVLVELQGFLRI
jgi:acetylcholinesterase